MKVNTPARLSKLNNKLYKMSCYLFLGIFFITPFIGAAVSMWGHGEVSKILVHPAIPDIKEWSLGDIAYANDLNYIVTGKRVIPADIMLIWNTVADVFPTLRTGPFLDGIQDIINFFLIWIALQTAAVLLYWFVIRGNKKRRR